MKKNAKFIVGAVMILSAIVYLGVTGFQQDLSYYKTVDEVYAMGKDAYDKQLRVAGNVVAGTIDRSNSPMKFQIAANAKVINVAYVGNGPVPDTFQDECETVVQGKFNNSGVFEANHIQAKCASKYETKLEEATTVSYR